MCGQVNNSESSYLSDAQPVSDNAVHSVGVHLSPLELEAVDSGPVLPKGAVGVVVELWRVRLTWREAHKNMKSTNMSQEFEFFFCSSVSLQPNGQLKVLHRAQICHCRKYCSEEDEDPGLHT